MFVHASPLSRHVQRGSLQERRHLHDNSSKPASWARVVHILLLSHGTRTWPLFQFYCVSSHVAPSAHWSSLAPPRKMHSSSNSFLLKLLKSRHSTHPHSFLQHGSNVLFPSTIKVVHHHFFLQSFLPPLTLPNPTLLRAAYIPFPLLFSHLFIPLLVVSKHSLTTSTVSALPLHPPSPCSSMNVADFLLTFQNN